ncbi:MAG: hypothetical protein KF722_10440 [Nitrospira sp.]|nr:hypothetical protein [Nitrospira sp.]
MMARKSTVKVGWGLLVCLLGIGGCASSEPLDMSSYDPSHDQKAIASYYRDQAVSMREKANAQATAAARYEALFGPEADLVSGARLLARYYEQTAQELERVAEAHAAVDRSRQRSPTVP